MNYSDVEKEIQEGIDQARKEGVACGDAICISVQSTEEKELNDK